MSDWKVLYRDQLDQDRTSRSIPSKEAALKQASDLYYQQRAELYRIEGPNGRALPKKEIMHWISTNMKSGHRISPDTTDRPRPIPTVQVRSNDGPECEGAVIAQGRA